MPQEAEQKAGRQGAEPHREVIAAKGCSSEIWPYEISDKRFF
jgi:hypothetical protein